MRLTTEDGLEFWYWFWAACWMAGDDHLTLDQWEEKFWEQL